MQPPEWKGSQPQRFSGGRKHLAPEGELNNLLQSSSLAQHIGIRTFDVHGSPEYQFKPVMKVC